MPLLSLFIAAICLAAAAASPAWAGTILGRIAEPGVVWVDDGSVLAPGAIEVRNVRKSFLPPLSIVPVGTTVRFPNDDNFYHSIYSDSEADPFDIGYYPTGPGKDVTFAQLGVVEVRCHIHDMMHATIIVVSGPSFMVTDPKNHSFILASVRAGSHDLHAWSPARGLRTLVVKIPRDGRIVANL